MCRKLGLIIILSGLIALITTIASAFVLNSGRPFGSDPNLFLPVTQWEGFQQWTTKTRVSPAALPPGKTLYLIMSGEGNSAGVAPTQYVPVNSGHIFNISVFDGGIYQATDPLLGHTAWGYLSPNGSQTGSCFPNCGANGSLATRLADNLILSGTAANVVLAPVSIFQSLVSSWGGATLQPGGNQQLGRRVQVACNRIQALGATPSAILFGQGETDSFFFPGGGSVYAINLANFIAIVTLHFQSGPTCKTTAGPQVPLFIAQESYIAPTGVDASNAAAQAAAVDNVKVFAGPNLDSIGASMRTSPAASVLGAGPPVGTYFDDAGMAQAAVLWQNALHAYGPPF